MNIEARRIAPPRRARFLQLAIAAAVLAGAATGSTVMPDTGASQRMPSADTGAALGELADGSEGIDVAATNAIPLTLPDAVDVVTAPSTRSLLYAPLAAGAVFCCFGWATTRFKRRPIRSSAQAASHAAALDLDLIAPRAARHNSSDSIAA